MEEKKSKQKKATETKVSKLKEKEAQIATLEQNIRAKEEQLLRNRAELENFKRRTNDEVIKERKYIHSAILKELLEVYDNLERAIEFKYPDVKSLKSGLKNISTQIKKIFEKEQVKEIEAKDKAFDPLLHHAVAVEANLDIADDIVVDVLNVGYLYKDMTLRPAMVKVNKVDNHEDKNESKEKNEEKEKRNG